MGHSATSVGALHGAPSEGSPYGIESKKLAIWLFIIADAATFGAILFAYGYLRLANPDWTKPFAFSPTIVNGIVMTVVLLTSSLTMVAAVDAAQTGRTSVGVRWLGATMLLGIAFAALHLREWFAMIGDGLGFTLVPWTPTLEKHFGRHVSGVAKDGGGIEWGFGRKRRLEI